MIFFIVLINAFDGVAITARYNTDLDSNPGVSVSGQSAVADADSLAFDFSFTDEQCSGTSVQFTSTELPEGEIVYSWNFGDGSTSSEKNPSHNFNSLGCGEETFNVTLEITHGDSILTPVTKPVVVKQAPEISFYDVDRPFSPFNNCADASVYEPEFTVNLGNSSPVPGCVLSYQVDWGDGTSVESGVSFPLNHVYTSLGEFQLKITAIADNGCSNSITYTVKNVTNPSVGITSPGTTTNLCAPTDELEFEIAKWGSNSPGTIYAVAFGDGETMQITQEEMMASPYYNAADPENSQNYPIPHSYIESSCGRTGDQFVVTINAHNGCSSTTASVNNITVIAVPEPEFDADTIVCMLNPVSFENISFPGYNPNCNQDAEYTWNFGDGTPPVTTSGGGQTHVFTNPGTYTVTLSLENYCGDSIYSMPIVVNPLPEGTLVGGDTVCQQAPAPVIVFTGSNGQSPYTFAYRINGGTVQTIKTEDDSDTVSIEVPTTISGVFTYELISVTESSEAMCSQDQAGEVVIVVLPTPAGIIESDADVCLNDPSPVVTFTGTNGTGPFTFQYTINDGAVLEITSSPGNSASIDISTSAAGTFVYKLLGIQDRSSESCDAVLNDSVVIHINSPPAELTLADYESCNGDSVGEIMLADTALGVTVEWTNSNTSIGLAASGTDSIPSFKTTNLSAEPVDAVITLTPFANGCPGATQSFTIKVNPAVDISFSEPDQMICSADSSKAVSLTSSVSSVDLFWTVEQPAGIAEAITLSGTNRIPAEKLTNTTILPIELVYQASATLVANSSCSGQQFEHHVVVNPKPVITTTFIDSICSGESFQLIPENNMTDLVPDGTTYTWTEPVVSPVISIAGAVAENMPQAIINQTLVNESTQIAQLVYTITPTAYGCEGDPFELIVYVVPGAHVDPVEDFTVCSGDSLGPIIFNGQAAFFSWTADNASIGLAGFGQDSIARFEAINQGTEPIVVTLEVTAQNDPGSLGCETNTEVFTITVNPRPVINSLFSDTICSGETFSFGPVHGNGDVVPSGITYSWDDPLVSPVIAVAGAEAGTSDSGTISQTLYNESSQIAKVVYTVIPAAYGCTGEPFEAEVYVIPGASVNPVGDLVVCSGDSIGPIYFEGNSFVFDWMADANTIGLPMAGVDSIAPFLAINNGQSPVTVSVSVSGKNDLGGAACNSSSESFSITVNPSPVITAFYSDTICSGESFNINPTHGNGEVVPGGTTYTWAAPTISPAVSVTGAQGEATPQTTISQLLINESGQLVELTYTITPEANGCEGEAFTATVYVIPNPVANPVEDLVLCSGDLSTAIELQPAGSQTTFEWTIDRSDIGLQPVSGVNTIPQFQALNLGTEPLVGVVTVIARNALGNQACSSAAVQFNITVNPAGFINNPGELAFCFGELAEVNFGAGSTDETNSYSWTNTNPDIGLPASGQGNLSFEATNTTDSIITAQITVVPTFQDSLKSCTGSQEVFTIRILPEINVFQPANQTVCNGRLTEAIQFISSSPLVQNLWEVDVPSIGLSSQGEGDIPAFTAINDALDSIVATIRVKPQIGSCLGEEKTFQITVLASPVITRQPSSRMVCLGEVPAPLVVLHTSGLTAPTYQWYSIGSNNVDNGVAIPGATDPEYQPAYDLANTRYYYCVVTFPSGGCNTLVSEVSQVTINPNPVVFLNDGEISRGEELMICPGDSILVESSGAASYEWNASTSGSEILLDLEGDYRVIGISEFGCRDTFTFSLAYYDPFNYLITSDKTEVSGSDNEIQLSATDISGSYYQWDMGDGSFRYGQNVIHSYQVDQDGSYNIVLEVVNPNGCREYAYQTIWASMEDVPNTFTPNGDGINDLYLQGWRIQIYNRNGILMYEGSEGWDGRYKNKPVDSDTYFVVIYDSTQRGTVKKTQYVTVIR